MKKLYEEDAIYNENHAKELLAIQAEYNKKLEALNTELAKKKSNLAIKYLNMAQSSAVNKTNVASSSNNTAKQGNGTVNNSGQSTDSKGNVKPTVESYSDILRINLLDENEEERFSYYGHDEIDKRNWYQKPEFQRGYEPYKIKRPKKWNDAVLFKRENLKNKIEYLNQELEDYKQYLDSPNHKNVELEIEEFFSSIGDKASEILNSGVYSTTEDIVGALRNLGIKNPKETVETYYYYYPQFNPELEKKRKKAEKQIPIIKNKIEKLKEKLLNLKHIYESTYKLSNVDAEDLQATKDYMDAENIAYIEDEKGDSIEFDEFDFDEEMREDLPNMGFEKEENMEDDDILSIEDDDEDNSYVESNDDIENIDKKINEEKVFYVKVNDEGKEFIGKIYKLFDEGDWRAKVIKGKSKTFEKLNYSPDQDEFDIIAFLRENYKNAELISEEEFNEYVEESEELAESIHKIPSLEKFLNECV